MRVRVQGRRILNLNELRQMAGNGGGQITAQRVIFETRELRVTSIGWNVGYRTAVRVEALVRRGTGNSSTVTAVWRRENVTRATTGVLGPRLGIALAPDRLWAVRGGMVGSRAARREDPRIRALAPLGDGTAWPDLAAALAELRAEMGGRGGTIAIALLPLVQLRRLDLPPLGDQETQHVLSRGAARYFVGVREPQSVSVSRILRRWRRTGAVIAAATPTRIVSAIVAAAEEAGWRVSAIAPAHAAWVAAARADAPRLAGKSARLVVLRDEGTELIRIDGGAISATRHLARAGAWIEQLADALVEQGDGDGPLPALAAGGGPRRRELVAALNARGITVAGGDGGMDAAGDSPEATAAAYALAAAEQFDLLPPRIHVERRRRTRLSTAVVAGVAAVALMVTAFAQLWGTRRELAAVKAERARVKSAVGQVIDARRVIEDIERRLAALAPYEAGATRWSSVIAQLAAHLPRDAHLLSLAGSGDTVAVEGIALRAPGVVRAMQRAPGIDSVVASRIQYDISDSGASTHRFELAMVLTPSDSLARGRGNTRQPAGRPSRPAPAAGPPGGRSGSGRGGTR